MSMHAYTEMALQHMRYLSETIGGRGSCTAKEQQAAEYVRDQLEQMGARNVRVEKFEAVPSTYWPFALAFAAALTGSLLTLLLPQRVVFTLGALLNAMGAWGMLAETEFAPNWMRWLLPKASSQNVVADLPPRGQISKHVILSAHLDTHRTPIFYSSRAWHKAFGLLVGLAFLSMILGALGSGFAALFSLYWLRWLSLMLIPIQAFALSLCLHADFTPYAPGANDDASGVGVILGLIERLRDEPLANIQVHLALTGCEEVGAYGMSAYLEAHAQEWGKEAVYIILDEVGLGILKYLSMDGLVIKHATHPRAMQLLRDAARSLPEVPSVEKVGIAYTDALVATKRGLIALTICSHTPADAAEVSHWHQMSDTMEHIQPSTLEYAHQFTYHLLQRIDQSAEANAHLGDQRSIEPESSR